MRTTSLHLVLLLGWTGTALPLQAQFDRQAKIGGGAGGTIVTNAPGSYTVSGGGQDIWDVSDEFTFHYAEVTGDFDVKARVESLEKVARWTKAGLMARESIACDSRMALVRLTPAPPGEFANDVRLAYRTGRDEQATGGGYNGGQHEDPTNNFPAPAYPNAWLRLERAGNVVRAYSGTNGSNWALLGSQNTFSWQTNGVSRPLADTLLLGLAASRHPSGTAATARAEFRNFSDTTRTPPQIAQHPADAMVREGQSATFRVRLRSFYDPTVTFQWLKDGVAIAGATGAVYTTPPATLNDDSARFRVRVTNALGQMTSSERRLEVLPNPALLGASSRGHPANVFVFFDENLDPATGLAVTNYTLNNGALVIEAAFAPGVATNGAQMVVRLSTTTLAEGTSYTVTVRNVRDPQGNRISPSTSIATFTHGEGYESRRITMKRYEEVCGATLADLLNALAYPQAPSSVSSRSLFEIPVNTDDFYGAALAGYYVAPMSGNYTFYVCADDQGAVYLATDAEPAHKVLIAFEPEWNGSRDYSGTTRRPRLDNRTNTIALAAGQRVYLEAVFKEHITGENLSVGVQLPGGAPPTAPISASDFLPVRDFAGTRFQTLGPITLAPLALQTVAPGETATFAVAIDGTPPHSVQWFSNHVAIAGATGSSYTTPPASARMNGVYYRAVVSNEFSSASRLAMLTVAGLGTAQGARWEQPPGFLTFPDNPDRHGGARPSDFDWVTLSTNGFTNLAVLDQQYLWAPPDDREFIIDAGFQRAQTFTAGTNGLLTRVDVFIRRDSQTNSGDLWFELRTTTGAGAPIESDVPLLGRALPAAEVPTSFGLFTLDLSGEAIPVTNGQVLAIVLRTAPGSPNASYRWRGTGTNRYAGGAEYSRGTVSTTWITSAGLDASFRTLVVPESAVAQPNWVIADDFYVDDDRPINAVRWWGSYLPGYTNGFEDGFVLSFFAEAVRASSGTIGGFASGYPGRLVGTYVAPRAAIRSFNTGLTGWDGNAIHQYEVELEDTCLVHADTNFARSTEFFVPGIVLSRLFWLAIDAEVGRRFVPQTNASGVATNWVEEPTGQRATNDFWGWHTSPITNGSLSPSMMNRIFMQDTNWIYPENAWTSNALFHMERDQAFALLSPCLTLVCPSNQTAWTCSNSYTVFFEATARALCDTNLTVICAPPSGTAFPSGTNVVTCRAADRRGNSNSCSFTVTVIQDSGPPMIACPPDIVESTLASGIAVGYSVTAWDDCDTDVTLSCAPPSGAFFLIGTTTVNCTATDDCGNTATCRFRVNVAGPASATNQVAKWSQPPGFLAFTDRNMRGGDRPSDFDWTALMRTNVPVLDQSYVFAPPDDREFIIDTSVERAQTFTVGAAGTLNRVEVYIRRDSAANQGDLLFDLRSTTGGAPIEPNTPVLASLVLPAGSIVGPYRLFSVDVSAFGISVTPGQVLAIVLRVSPATPGAFYRWAGSAFNPYPRGALYNRGAIVGPTWTLSGGGTLDASFRTYVETNAPSPNWIIADDFRSDGRPIVSVRWWGSYLPGFTNGFEDGFVLSFFTDVPAAPPGVPFSRPGQLLGTYLAPFPAVRSTNSGYVGWDGYPIYGYEVALRDACLDHAVTNLATPPAFLEVSNTVYWLAISAEVGHRIVGRTNQAGVVTNWVEQLSTKRATNHFWGWHTSPTNWNDASVMGRLSMVTNAWIYGAWMANGPFHMELDQAFELLTTNAPIVPPELADYGDAPDGAPACGTVGGIGYYPTLFGTSNAVPGRTGPYHVPTAPPGLADYQLGGAPTLEPAPFQPVCDWLTAGCDLDDAPVVLCLDPACASGVVGGGISVCNLGFGGCFGPPPPMPTLGFWVFTVTRGPFSFAPGFVNVDVDWNLSGTYGDNTLEWALRDDPVTAPPFATEVKTTPPFPVITVTVTVDPMTGETNWAIAPFWSRFHLSDEAMLATFNGTTSWWDGSGRLGGYTGGETEDWVVECDPPSGGRHPPPQYCVTATGQLMLSLDPTDATCARGATVDLQTRAGTLGVIREFRLGSYATGQSVLTELQHLELSGTDSPWGAVIVRERTNRFSFGQINQVVANPEGNLSSGHSFMDVHLEIELPAQNLRLDTGPTPLRLDAGNINAFPPVGTSYASANAQGAIALFRAGTSQQLGWLCQARYTVASIEACPNPACPPSALRITRSGTNVVLSWNGSGYRLQSASALGHPGSSTVWTDVPGSSPLVRPATRDKNFFRLICVAPASPSFALGANPQALGVAQGSNGTSLCTLTATGGFGGTVTLSCIGLPAGVSFGFSANPVTLPPDGVAQSTLTLNVGQNVAPGIHPFQVRATSGNFSRTIEMHLAVALGGLSGPPGEAANAHVPDIPFPTPRPADYVYSDEVGTFISTRELLLVFQDNVTIAEANALLQSVSALIGGADSASKVLLLQVPMATTAVQWELVQTLSLNSKVRLVAPDSLLEEKMLPAHNPDYPANAGAWNVMPDGGDWNMEAVRAPQAWNFLDAMRRRNKLSQVGVLDTGFMVGGRRHRDVDFHLTYDTLGGRNRDQNEDHGGMVSGVIGAIWGNRRELDGINPNAHIVATATPSFRELPDIDSKNRLFFSRLISDFASLRLKYRSIRFYSCSLGYIDNSFIKGVIFRANGQAGTAAQQAAAQDFVRKQGEAFKWWFQNLERDLGPCLLCVSAGNESGLPRFDLSGRWATPFNVFAAPISMENVWVIEGTENKANYPRADFSNSGPDPIGLAAPGAQVALLRGNDSTAREDGTSFSAPLVAGAASFLNSYSPIPLDLGQIREALSSAARPAQGNRRRHLDLFSSVLYLDRFVPAKLVQKELVDVDDGTRDGNLRMRYFSDDPDPDDIHTGDHRRGDNRVSMRDFRAWRDAYLYLHEAQFTAAGLTVSLDGPGAHFKRDLNLDGCIGGLEARPPHPIEIPPATDCSRAPTENDFPRYDFNGDGRVTNWFVTAPFKSDASAAPGENRSFDLRAPPGLLRDIDVLADRDLWSPAEKDTYEEHVFVDPATEGTCPLCEPVWAPYRYLAANRDGMTLAPDVLKTVPDYIHSFDIHFKINWDMVDPGYEEILIHITSEIWPDGMDNDGDTVVDEPYEVVFRRIRYFPRGFTPAAFTVTIPVWTGKARVYWTGIDRAPPGPSVAQDGYFDSVDVKLGEDRKIEIPQDMGTP